MKEIKVKGSVFLRLYLLFLFSIFPLATGACSFQLIRTKTLVTWIGTEERMTASIQIPTMSGRWLQTPITFSLTVILVDQFTGFPESELSDGIHPNVVGYTREWQASGTTPSVSS